MAISPLFIAVIIFVGSIVLVRSTATEDLMSFGQDDEQNSIVSTETPSNAPTDSINQITPTISLTPSPSLRPTTIPTSTYTPSQPTSTPSSNQDSGIPQYPGSQLISSSGSTKKYQTNDDASTVGDWYKQQIVSQGFNVKSFITTRANEHSEIVLSAASSNNQIKITIVQDGDSVTTISVE